MPKRYGPWATMIDVGDNLQLSTFWRRRIAMLPSVSRCRPILSQRSVACLLVAGAVFACLPTLRVNALAAEVMSKTAPEPRTGDAPQAESAVKHREADEQPAGTTPGKPEIASATTKAAHEAYDAAANAFWTGRADIEAVYRWSYRWMQADRADHGDAAIQAHLDRMRSLYEKISPLHETGSRGGEDTNFTAAHFYVEEAKQMLKQTRLPGRNR
jgi:hypothetical protein